MKRPATGCSVVLYSTSIGSSTGSDTTAATMTMTTTLAHDDTPSNMTTTSKALGDLTRIELQQQQRPSSNNNNGDANEESVFSYVEMMRIPTFLCSGGGLLDETTSVVPHCNSNGHDPQRPEQHEHNEVDSSSLRIIENISWYAPRNNNSIESIYNNIYITNTTINNEQQQLQWQRQYGPAFTISSVVSPKVCHDIISACEMAMSSSNIAAAAVDRQSELATNCGTNIATTTTTRTTPIQNVIRPNDCSNNWNKYDSKKKNQHGAMQLIVSQATVDAMAHIIAPFIPIHMVEQRKFELEHEEAYASSISDHDRDESNTKTNPNARPVDVEVDDSSSHHHHNTTKTTTKLQFVGLNRRFRVYKYAPNDFDHFKPHIDAGFPPSGITTTTTTTGMQSSGSSNNDTTASKSTTTILQFDDTENYIASLQQQQQQQNDITKQNSVVVKDVVSRLTILLYLNDNFNGGTTNFYEPLLMRRQMEQDLPQNERLKNSTERIIINSDPNQQQRPPATTMIASVRPKTGMALIFPQCVGSDIMESYAKYYWPTHEGSSVQNDSKEAKYVIRSDLLFAEVINNEK